jgi:hypothetical protein
MQSCDTTLFFEYFDARYRTYAEYSHGVANPAASQGQVHNLALRLEQMAFEAVVELKNRPLARRILTTIALRAIFLPTRFDYVEALTIGTVYLNDRHDLFSCFMQRSLTRNLTQST